MHARGVEALMTELARAVGISKWHDDQIANLDPADFGADGLDASDRLMPHGPPGLDRLEFLVRPKIAPADAGSCDADQRVSWLDKTRVGNVLDANVAGTIH